MKTNLTSDLNTISKIIDFERSYSSEAQSLLQNQYGVSQNLSFNIVNRVFKKMCNISLQFQGANVDILWKAFDRLAKEDIKHIKRRMSKNFNLTENEFNRLVIALKDGDESIFENIFLVHIESCIQFLKRKYKLSYDEAYDYSMDALLLFRKKLLNDKISYGNLRFLLTQMAGQIFLKNSAKKEKQKDVTSIFESVSNEEHFRLLERSFDELGENCQKLLKLYYYEDINLKTIAEAENKTALAIRKQKQRCVFTLKTLYKKFSKTII